MKSTILLSLLLFACDDRSSGLMSAPPAPADTGTAVPVDSAAPPDVAAEPFDPYPNDWIEAPDGLCDNIDNLAETTYVIDGDTVALTIGKKVRYIGVDAPETKSNDCWSQQAKQALSEMTPMGTTVCLQHDGDSEDAFGRLLRYVYVKRAGRWVMENARVVRLGASRAYRKFLAGKAYAPQIEEAEDDARKEDLGGWAHCTDWK